MSRFFVLILFVVLSAAAISAQNPAQKKNARPSATPDSTKSVTPAVLKPVFFYSFAKPEFLVSKIHIEHDENGKGLIRFEKKELEEEFTKPLVLSAATIELLTNHWDNLEFLTSSEDYQSSRDYAHLGTMVLKMDLNGKARSAKFNWTENQDVKALTAEYTKISNEYVWMFDIEVARRNQPLESPRLVKRLDSFLKRGQISDPPHILPYLMELSADERMPLIARNHVKRLADYIGKNANKK